MTSKRLFLFLCCFILKQNLVGQVVPPPATQSEVDAGANRFKYVTPYTLNNWSGAGGGTNGGTPGGATPMIQMNMGGNFVGTTNLVYDVTNSRVGLNIGANRPNSYLEIGGSGSIGSGIRVGSSTTSNTNLFDGGGLGMAGDYSMRIYMASGVVWYLDNSVSPYAIHPATTNLADIGTFLLPVRTNWSTWAVVKDTMTVGSLTVNSSSRGSLQLNGTNGTPVVIMAASSNSVPVTNVVGLIHKASAAVIVVDCNNANKFQITNQLGQGTSIIVTNLAQGQEISISGSADGTSRTVTVIPQLGFLVRDFDTFGVAAAANKAITATNGNTFEINIAAKWGFGTNFADVVTRQAKY